MPTDPVSLTSPLRFALSYHSCDPQSGRKSHFDLFLESNGKLLTWELASKLSEQTSTLCKRLADHRLHYLDWDGDVSGNRGTVKRIEVGKLTWLQQKEEQFQAALCAPNFSAKISLTRIEADCWRIEVHDWQSTAH